MAQRTEHGLDTNLGLLILAGIGAGTLLGASVGLLLGRRALREDDHAMTDTVSELKDKAQRVLSELQDKVAAGREQAPRP